MLSKENTFERLEKINHFLLMSTDYKINEVLSLLFLWKPVKLSFFKKDRLNYILVSPLNSYQIISLMEKNIPIYYMDESKIFIPWNHKFRGREKPFTIIFPDGKKDTIDIDSFLDFEKIVNFKVPKIEVEKKKSFEELEVGVELKDDNSPFPKYFMIKANKLYELIKAIKFDMPWYDYYKKYSFLVFEMKSERYILIEAERDSESEINERLLRLSFKAFYPFYEGYLNLEYGKTISPLLPFEILNEKYPDYELFLFQEEGKPQTLFFYPEKKVFYSFDKISSLVSIVYSEKIRSFLR